MLKIIFPQINNNNTHLSYKLLSKEQVYTNYVKKSRILHNFNINLTFT